VVDRDLKRDIMDYKISKHESRVDEIFHFKNAENFLRSKILSKMIIDRRQLYTTYS
jgi:hypothetical protein